MNKKGLLLTLCLAALLVGGSVVWANEDNGKPKLVQLVSEYPSLNQVNYAVSAEQWVSSDTARVIVGVNANLNNAALDHFQEKMNQNLASLAKDASWHLTQFDRNEDSSGLEQVTAQAEARIPNAKLAGLRVKAESLSQPGSKYRIIDIQYGPSDEDLQTAKQALRAQVYSSIAREIKTLNKLYSGQFFIHEIHFDPAPIAPTPTAYMMARAAGPAESSGGSVPVNQKLVLEAQVLLASKV